MNENKIEKKIDNCSLRSTNKKGINFYLNKTKNKFKQNKGDFNYIKINVTDKVNKDIKLTMINALKLFKKKIKEKYEQLKIKVFFEEEKDISFKICYEISPMLFDDNEIEFLDKEFEKKVKNIQKFEIKVELIEGGNDLCLIDEINQYYFLFIGVSIEKEDFYFHLKILKEIAFNLFLSRRNQ